MKEKGENIYSEQSFVKQKECINHLLYKINNNGNHNHNDDDNLNNNNKRN